MITIKSKKAGFRRCDIAHPVEIVEYPNDRFTDAELAMLEAEPMLTVAVVPFPVFPEPAGSRNGKDGAEKTAAVPIAAKPKTRGK